MLQTRMKSSAACVIIVISGALISGCAKCPNEPRARADAVEMALAFAAQEFQKSSKVPTSREQLLVSSDRYQNSDRSWYFRVSTSDNKCQIEVAVPDCDAVESAGGGDCER